MPMSRSVTERRPFDFSVSAVGSRFVPPIPSDIAAVKVIPAEVPMPGTLNLTVARPLAEFPAPGPVWVTDPL